jgi:hypothetical protein
MAGLKKPYPVKRSGTGKRNTEHEITTLYNGWIEKTISG